MLRGVTRHMLPHLPGVPPCLHGGEGPQVGEVTRLGGVTCLSI